MSSLKQVVENDLKIRNVSPEVISDLDVLIARSILRLQRKNILPARSWEFESKTEKQEHRTSDEDFQYNFYYLPDDFRELDEFYVYGKDTYFLTERDSKIIQNESKTNRFTITEANFTTDSKQKDILIAKPFPEDDDIVRIKYYVNGKDFDYGWIDERWWEAVIADVKAIIGIGSEAASDYEAQNVAMEQKGKKGSGVANESSRRIRSRYFGRRTSRQRK